MALPGGISTATVTAGVPVTFSGGPIRSIVSIKPSVFLVHAATGTPLVDMMEEVNTTEGVSAQFTLPHTDQDGFTDENGNAYKNWFYTATIYYQTDRMTQPPKTKVFQLTSGQSVVDMDLLPGGAPALPYTAPAAVVSSVNGQTGAVTVEGATDTSVADLVVSGPETVAALNATIGTKAALDAADANTPLGNVLASTFARPTVPSLPHPRISFIVDPFVTGWTTAGPKLTSFANASTGDNSPVAATHAKVISNGAASGYLTLEKTLSADIDMTGKMFGIWVMFPDNTHVSTLDILVGDSGFTNYFNWRAVNATGSKTGFVPSGQWVFVTVPWARLTSTVGTPSRSALRRVRIGINDDGAGVATEFRIGGLAAVPEPAAWPNGVLSITFDDDSPGLLTNAAPKLMQYGMPATLFPISNRIDTPGYNTLEQYRRFQAIYGWDVMPHAADPEAHVSYNLATPEERREYIARTRAWHIDNGFPTEVFAWPNGTSNADADLDAKRYFQMVRGTDGELETWPPARPMYLRSYSSQAPTRNTSASLISALDKAIASKAWLIVVFHGITTTGAGALETSKANFDAFIDYAATSGVAIRTLSSVAKSSNN